MTAGHADYCTRSLCVSIQNFSSITSSSTPQQSGQNREMLDLMRSLQKQVEELQHGDDTSSTTSPPEHRRRLRSPLKVQSTCLRLPRNVYRDYAADVVVRYFRIFS